MSAALRDRCRELAAWAANVFVRIPAYPAKPGEAVRTMRKEVTLPDPTVEDFDGMIAAVASVMRGEIEPIRMVRFVDPHPVTLELGDIAEVVGPARVRCAWDTQAGRTVVTLDVAFEVVDLPARVTASK